MKRLLLMFLALSFLFASCAETELYNDDGFVPDDITATDTPEAVAQNDTFGVGFCKGESADPYATSNKINFELMGLISEPLFSVSESFEVTPVLSADYSSNGRVWTFTVKSGVTFSDGSPLTATDVRASFLAAMEPSSYYATRLSCVESVSSNKRAGTVTVTLKYENARFPVLLDFPIIKDGTRNNPIPTGTGIYVPDTSFTSLTARENHHSGKTPPYKTIKLCNITTSDELFFKFNTFDVSVFTTDPTDPTAKFPSISVELISVPTTSLHYLGFNMKNEKLADKNVRKAIATLVNGDSIAESDFALMGNASKLPLHPSLGSYPTELVTGLEYFSETKLTLNESLTILVNNENGAKLSACNRIAESLTKAGTPTTVRALPFEEYTAALRSGDFTLYYAEVALGADFDITRLISGSLNFGGFSEQSMTMALSAYLSGDEGLSGYINVFSDVVPFVPIFFKNTAMYTQKNFFEEAYPTSRNTYSDFCSWKIKKGY